ncbi:hypothetical protein CYMTET_29088 [Cymbomonas tetramitiformis]|uniref:Uncharacterized protein n=1 Tax=Cymbomonas tetramitiformis TaxID=36881 RepID=A0AAE0FM46_9CHLO|nr:hypothetical protein CYMTET_29088 [Cymbomonas tetramitiformis]
MVDTVDPAEVELFVNVTLSSALPALEKNFLLSGNCSELYSGACTIDGQNTFRVFEIKRNVVVNLRRVRIINGLALIDVELISGYGGGIFVATGASLILDSCSISSCVAEGIGGDRGERLAEVFGAECRCGWAGDWCALQKGGGMFFKDLLRDIETGLVELVNCDFEENHALIGGALFWRVSLSSQILAIDNSYFFHNLAGWSEETETFSGVGGGIAVSKAEYWSESKAVLRNSLLDSNEAYFAGSILSSTVELAVEDSRITRGFAEQHGGGLVSTCYSSDCLVTSQHVTISIIRSRISDCSSQAFGGAFLMTSNVHLSLVNSSVVGNSALYKGGGLYAQDSFIAMQQGLFANNTAGDESDGNHQEASGGGIWVGTSQVELVDMGFEMNVAGNSGGALHAEDLTTISVARTKFMENEANRGGACTLQLLTTGTFLEVEVSNNRAKTAGGIYVYHASTASFSRSVFSDNAATGFSDRQLYHRDARTFSSVGGVFGIVDAEAYVTYCNFSGNTAPHGGAIFSSRSFVSMNHSSVVNNTTPGDGGGLAGIDSTFELRDVQCRLNIAASLGGCLLSLYGNLTIVNSTFESNNAKDGAGLYEEVLSQDGADEAEERRFNGLVFTGNLASRNGGGMHVPFRKTGLGSDILWEGNDALRGSCVFFSHHDENANDTCANCVCSGNQTYASFPIYFDIEQPQGTQVDLVNCVSGYFFEPSLVYVARDHFHSVYEHDTTELISVTSYLMDNYSVIIGDQEARMASDGAHFDSLGVVGESGALLTMVFHQHFGIAIASDNMVVIALQLDTCRNGTTYNTDSYMCVTCAEGHLKFTNGTSPCVECVEGIICTGGNQFTVEKGYWLAPASSLCASDDMECFFSSIYKCDVPGACSRDDLGRSNEDGSMVVSAEKLCTPGHRSDVVICGTCAYGYTRDFMNTQKCISCDNDEETLMTTILFFFFMLLIVGGVAWFLMRLAKTEFRNQAASIWHNVQDISHHAVDDAFAYSSKYRRLHLMHILFGFLQVLGQSTSIYSSEDTIPAVFFQFLRLPTLLSIGLNRWIPASCLGASMGFEKNAVYHLGGSFNMLMAYAIFPVIVLLPIAYLACNKTIMNTIRVREERETLELPVNDNGERQYRSRPVREMSQDVSMRDLSDWMNRLKLDSSQTFKKSKTYKPGVFRGRHTFEEPSSGDIDLEEEFGVQKMETPRFSSDAKSQTFTPNPTYYRANSLEMTNGVLEANCFMQPFTFTKARMLPADSPSGGEPSKPYVTPLDLSRLSPSTRHDSMSGASNPLYRSPSNPLYQSPSNPLYQSPSNPLYQSNEETMLQFVHEAVMEGFLPDDADAMDSFRESVREICSNDCDEATEAEAEMAERGASSSFSTVVDTATEGIRSPRKIRTVRFSEQISFSATGYIGAEPSRDSDTGDGQTVAAFPGSGAVPDGPGPVMESVETPAPDDPQETLLHLHESGAMARGLDDRRRSRQATVMTHGKNGRVSLKQFGEDSAMNGISFIYMRLSSIVLIFMHPTVTTVMFQIYNCRAIYNDEIEIQYWVEQDLMEQCYTTHWWTFASVSCIVIIFYVVGLPLSLALITTRAHQSKKVSVNGRTMYIHRGLLLKTVDGRYFLKDTEHEVTPIYIESSMRSQRVNDEYNILTKLDSRLYQDFLGHWVMPFERDCFYWVVCDILHETMQSSAVLLMGLIFPDYDLLFAMLVASVTLAFYTHQKPHLNPIDSIFQTLVLLSHCMIFMVFMAERYVNSDASSDIMGIGLAFLIGTLLSTMVLAIIRHYFKIYSVSIQKLKAELLTPVEGEAKAKGDSILGMLRKPQHIVRALKHANALSSQVGKSALNRIRTFSVSKRLSNIRASDILVGRKKKYSMESAEN